MKVRHAALLSWAVLVTVGGLILVSVTPTAQAAPVPWTRSYTVPDYSAGDSAPDPERRIDLQLTVETEPTWIQGSLYGALVTIESTKAANVADVHMTILVVKVYVREQSRWVVIDGDPELLDTRASFAQVRTELSANAPQTTEGWIAIEISMNIRYVDEFEYSISPWRTNPDFGPIAFQANPLIYFRPSMLPLTILPIVAAGGLALWLLFRWRSRNRRRQKSRPASPQR